MNLAGFSKHLNKIGLYKIKMPIRFDYIYVKLRGDFRISLCVCVCVCVCINGHSFDSIYVYYIYVCMYWHICKPFNIFVTLKRKKILCNFVIFVLVFKNQCQAYLKIIEKYDKNFQSMVSFLQISQLDLYFPPYLQQWMPSTALNKFEIILNKNLFT